MWNEYFATTQSKDNEKLHTFYREFFDKPPGKRAPRVIPPRRSPLLDPPNLRSTLERSLRRIPAHSKAVSVASRLRERKWNDRFAVTYSKGNNQLYRTIREYFDSPKRGDRYGELRLETLEFKKPRRAHSTRRSQRHSNHSPSASAKP